MTSSHIGKTCPYCQYPIKNDSEVVICAECRIPHHRECWQENGGCTTFGHQGFREEAGPFVRGQFSVNRDDQVKGQIQMQISEKTGRLIVGIGSCILVLLVALLFSVLRISYNDQYTSDRQSHLSSAIDPAVFAVLDADYYLDYTNGTIPIGDLPIGVRVVDPSWEWEFRTGNDYTGRGEVKPVNWIVGQFVELEMLLLKVDWR